jgi:hypothetical protein
MLLLWLILFIFVVCISCECIKFDIVISPVFNTCVFQDFTGVNFALIILMCNFLIGFLI